MLNFSFVAYKSRHLSRRVLYSNTPTFPSQLGKVGFDIGFETPLAALVEVEGAGATPIVVREGFDEIPSAYAALRISSTEGEPEGTEDEGEFVLFIPSRLNPPRVI